MKLVLKDGSPSEDMIHLAAMKHLRIVHRLNKRAIHIANEGNRNFLYAKKLKHMGVTPGVYDIHIARARKGYHGMWLELKSKNGKLSPEQIKFKEEYEEEGYFCAEAWSIDEAIEHIDWYLKDGN